MRRVTPFIPSSFETCAPPLEGAYVRAPTNHVAAAVRAPYTPPTGGAHVGAPLPWSPLGRGRPRPYVPHAPPRPFTPPRSRPHAPHGPLAPRVPRPHGPTFVPPRAPRAPRPHACSHPHVCAPRPLAPHVPPRPRPPSTPPKRSRPPFVPHETCAPMEAVRALLRVRLLSISSSKLLFILPLRHPGLQLPMVDDC
jgi:hypothetical protein